MSEIKMNEVEMASGAVAAGNGVKTAAVYGSGKALAIATFCGGVFISAITMAIATPRSAKEMFCALISMFFFAACGQAFVVLFFGLNFQDDVNGIAAKTGIAAICGALGWLAVRGWFFWSEKYGIKVIASILNSIADRVKRL